MQYLDHTNSTFMADYSTSYQLWNMDIFVQVQGYHAIG